MTDARITPGTAPEAKNGAEDQEGKRKIEAGKAEAEKAEALRRKKAQEDFDRLTWAVWAKQSGRHFVEMHETVDASGKVIDMPTMQTAYTGLLKPGIYPSQELSKPSLWSLREKKGNWNYNVTEDGKITTSRPARNHKEFLSMASEKMDLLKQMGVTVIKIDWEKQKYVSEKYLKELLQMAKEKGLEVEFGSNVNALLHSQKRSGYFSAFGAKNEAESEAVRGYHPNLLTGEQQRARLQEFERLQQDTVAAAKQERNSLGYRLHAESLGMSQLEKKMNVEAANGMNKTELKAKLEDANVAVDQKIKLLEERIAANEKETNLIETAHSNLENKVKSIETRIQNATSVSQLNDLMREVEKNREERHTFIDKVVARQVLLSDMNQEVKAQLTNLKNAYPPQAERIDGLLKRQEEVEGKINKTEGGMKEVKTKMSATANKDENNILYQVNEKDKSLKGAAPAPAKP